MRTIREITLNYPHVTIQGVLQEAFIPDFPLPFYVWGVRIRSKRDGVIRSIEGCGPSRPAERKDLFRQLRLLRMAIP